VTNSGCVYWLPLHLL